MAKTESSAHLSKMIKLKELVLSDLLIHDGLASDCSSHLMSSSPLSQDSRYKLTPRKHLNDLLKTRLAPTEDLRSRSEGRVLQHSLDVETVVRRSVEPSHRGLGSGGKGEEVGAIGLETGGVEVLSVLDRQP